MKRKGAGLDIKQPEKVCSDKNCPFHGSISVRGRIFVGVVVSDKMAKSVTVAWGRKVFVPKYERYEKKKSKLSAHNPECISAKKGDVVRIAETKPLSKTKHFVVVEVIGKESKKELLREEAIQEAEVLAAEKSSKQKKEEKVKDKGEERKGTNPKPSEEK